MATVPSARLTAPWTLALVCSVTAIGVVWIAIETTSWLPWRQMSLLAVSAQIYFECGLGQEIPARSFVPPPKVNSQVVLLNRRQTPLFPDLDAAGFFRVVKAGFSERRKKLRSSLAGGLKITKEEADELLREAGIDGNLRAQELSLEQWHSLAKRTVPLLRQILD